MLRLHLTRLRVATLLMALPLAGCGMALDEGNSSHKAKPATRQHAQRPVADPARAAACRPGTEAFTVVAMPFPQGTGSAKVKRTMKCRPLAW